MSALFQKKTKKKNRAVVAKNKQKIKWPEMDGRPKINALNET